MAAARPWTHRILGRFGGRHAWMITLEGARDRWTREAGRLRDSRDLSDRERDLLRPVVRQFCVRMAALRRSFLVSVELALVGSAGAACLLAPVAVVGPAAVRVLDAVGLLAAAAGYLAVFGTVSTLYLRPFLRPRLIRLGLSTTLACLLIFIVSAVVITHPQPALRYAGAAGGLAVLTVTAGRFGLIFRGAYGWVPIKYRSGGHDVAGVVGRVAAVVAGPEAGGRRWSLAAPGGSPGSRDRTC
jgi:hypothetical protein